MYKPTKGMQEAAQRALNYNMRVPRSQQWGTAIGRARALQLANRKMVSESIVRRIYSYLSRARIIYINQKISGNRSKGYYAYLGWGGDPGLTWSRKIIEEIDYG